MEATMNSQDSGSTKAPQSREVRKLRACEACRHLKVPCRRDDSAVDRPCQRCARGNRPCITTASKRRRQKQTTSRVAELEKKIDALTASLATRSDSGTPGDENVNALGTQMRKTDLRDPQDQSRPDVKPLYTSGNPVVSRQSTNRSTSEAGISTSTSNDPIQLSRSSRLNNDLDHRAPLSEVQAYQAFVNGDPYAGEASAKSFGVDVIDSGLLDAATAYQMFDRYNSELCRQLLWVVFPSGTSGLEIRQSKPLLFLAILSVTCGTVRPDLHAYLTSKATRIVGDRIMFQGKKSLEIVQTLQVLVTFYVPPPHHFQEMNFSQLISIAATMTYDIGLGKRMPKSGPPASFPGKGAASFEANAVEGRRCWLGCYYDCGTMAMALRRPFTMRWTLYHDECLDILTNSPDALPSDKWFCHLIRLQHIAEDVATEFSMDDPISKLSITESRVQYQIKTFERRLAEWYQNAMLDMTDIATVQYNEAIVNLYIHEIALHHDHNVDDFLPECHPPAPEAPKPDFVTPAHISSLTICLSSIHSAFDAFLSMDTMTHRALPVIVFVRMLYAAVALVKMHSVITVKDAKFSSVFDPADLKTDYYLDCMMKTVEPLASGGRGQMALMFFDKFEQLKQCFLILEHNHSADGLSHQSDMQTSSGPSANNSVYSAPYLGSNTSVSSISGGMAASTDLNGSLGNDSLPGSRLNNFDFMPDDLDAILMQMDDPDWFSFGSSAWHWPSMDTS